MEMYELKEELKKRVEPLGIGVWFAHGVDSVIATFYRHGRFCRLLFLFPPSEEPEVWFSADGSSYKLPSVDIDGLVERIVETI